VQPRVFCYAVDGWGVGEVWLADERLVWHELPRVGGGPDGGDHPLVERIRAYFDGEPVGFDGVELELDWCTPFQRSLADTLRRVSYGETVTYGELAALAGYPNAQRAAGSFCARNRFPLFLPCHRVVAADGIGSYGSLGVDYKRRLLALEGVSWGLTPRHVHAVGDRRADPGRGAASVAGTFAKETWPGV
jgi:methylated-DNA-[protein]-cysteine S-methyltransferase